MKVLFGDVEEERHGPRPLTDSRWRPPSEFRGGTLCFNGPGQFRRGATQKGHWFDGDGLIRSIRLEHGGATYSHAFVDTPSRRWESQREQVLCAGLAQPAGGRAVPRGTLPIPLDAANTSVRFFRKELWALYESRPPQALQPSDLRTRGANLLGGVLAPDAFFSAHPAPYRGGLVNFGSSYAEAALKFYRLPPQGEASLCASVKMPINGYVHDMAITGDQAVVAVSPWVVPEFPSLMPLGVRNFFMAIIGRFSGQSVVDLFAWKPQLGSHFGLVDLKSGTAQWLQADAPFFCFHLGNTFVRDGTTFVDLCRYPQATPMTEAGLEVMCGLPPTAPHAELVRYALRGGRAQQVPDRARPALEFPCVAEADRGLDARYLWGLAYTQEVPQLPGIPARVEAATGAMQMAYMARGEYGSEPQLVDNFLLCLVSLPRAFDSEVRLFRTDTWQAGARPISCVRIGLPQPLMFHGTFVPEAAAQEPPA